MEKTKTPKTRKNQVSHVEAQDIEPISDAIMDAPDADDGTEMIIEEPLMHEITPQAPRPAHQRSFQSAPIHQTEEQPKKIINCLRDEIITIRFLPHETGFDMNPKNSLYGGMAENAVDRLVVPVRRDGSRLVDPLTNEEKAFFEYYLGLGTGALSVYHKPCYWSSSTKDAVNFLLLTKGDTRLNLKDPYDYLRYAIARCNKEIICPSQKDLVAHRSQTYKYVMISSKETKDLAHSNAKKKLDCSKMLMNYIHDKDQLITILKGIEGKRMAPNTDADIVLNRIQDHIYKNTEAAFEAIQDPNILVKTIIDVAIRKGVIIKRNGIYRDAESKEILAFEGVASTYQAMVDFLNDPDNHDMRARIEELNKD